MQSFLCLCRRFGGRVNSVCAIARSPRDALARSEYPNRQDRNRMFRYNVSLAISFTVRFPSFFFFAEWHIVTRSRSFLIYADPLTHKQVLESELPTTVGRTKRGEKPNIGNGVRSKHPRRCQNSRYQVHAEGHFSPD